MFKKIYKHAITILVVISFIFSSFLFFSKEQVIIKNEAITINEQELKDLKNRIKSLETVLHVHENSFEGDIENATKQGDR